MTPEDPPYSAGAKSITHPDFEPVWSAAEDLGMAAFGHFGFSKEKIHVGWAHNGRGLSTYNLLSHMLHFQTAPQLLLGAMIFDGLFERHPKLTVVMEEVRMIGFRTSSLGWTVLLARRRAWRGVTPMMRSDVVAIGS